MDATVQFLIRHGYLVLFIFVMAEQIGLPLPAIPLLLAAGALAHAEKLDYSLILLLGVIASLIADLLWYEIGRRRGGQVLEWLCRIALEPDSCVRKTERIFDRHGGRSLLLAKFVPGLNTAAPPLAGMLRMPLWRFLLLDAMGAILWIGLFTGLGYAFSQQLERAAAWALSLGGAVGTAVGFGSGVGTGVAAGVGVGAGARVKVGVGWRVAVGGGVGTNVAVAIGVGVAVAAGASVGIAGCAGRLAHHTGQPID